MVDRLERAGLVRREATTEDRRVARATLTQAGIELLYAAHQTYISAVRHLFLDHLSEEELATLGVCWERLSGHPPAND
jgi:DNA-binding MarR family transcriptional regulator